MNYFPYLYWDPTLLLMIPGIIVAIWAQARVNSAYNTYSRMPVMSGITGREMAARILSSHGIQGVQIDVSSGVLTDSYHPLKRTLSLSEANYSGSSVAAVAVAAHECGHALQHGSGYLPLKIRNAIAPVVSFASYLLWPLLIFGILLGYANTLSIVVYIFLGIFVFQLITLPVEFNASRRALAALSAQNMLTEEELYGARKMLNAAALTYVAATLTALLNVLRFAMLSNRRK
ncbi:MAG: zinc metallopeptidase [Christensenellaceae bacterium]|nr:zinc metallopeptidase [Christensenellaceae bacterium]